MKHINGRAFSCGALALTIAASTAGSATPATSKAAAHAAHAAPSAADREKAKVAAKQAAVLLLAPADEYFGPLKVSIIGIRNTMRDLGLRYDVNHDTGPQTYCSAQLVERAIRDWEKKYPHDDQLPRAVFFLQRLYVKILTQPARDHATAVASWMFKDFGTSPQSKQLQKTIALEHLAPIPAGALLAMPSPTTAPLAAAPAAPAAPSPAAAAVATAPVPVTTASAAAPTGAATIATAPVSGTSPAPSAATASPAAGASSPVAPAPTLGAAPDGAAPIAEAAAASAALGTVAPASSDAPRTAVRQPAPAATPASTARVTPPASVARVAPPTARSATPPAAAAPAAAGDATTEGAAYGSSFGAGYPSIFAPAPGR